VNPPLRAAADVDRLWRAFHDGDITCLGSDHGTGGRTHATKAKGGPKHGNIWNARSGNRGGLEHFLPVLMTFGVHAGRISIGVARVGALNTARCSGCIREGALVPGADADVVIVDPDRGRVDDRYHCLCETSVCAAVPLPRHGRTTVVRGRVMMDEFGTVGAPGWGRYVPRGDAAGRRLDAHRLRHQLHAHRARPRSCVGPGRERRLRSARHLRLAVDHAACT
jgi:dihydroorotase-like cyclic amidohydrolase